ncbi:hypothetical protein BGW36DRAFT_409282 [Talaromyces proteolyticus]|uniref:Uncharacterized protein n=1 Tax=Talaromyces proteolyticus TaxID=1131652 RepID=A0AAD4KL23_9EURO|nr:uncharacterized protein BGW36DRAFT_409282 [Talaromyces proteolyticus]KAH8693621.1 hypothetical protein BGW36DRAFT_409282 [Talaromyces proteolyticus]
MEIRKLVRREFTSKNRSFVRLAEASRATPLAFKDGSALEKVDSLRQELSVLELHSCEEEREHIDCEEFQTRKLEEGLDEELVDFPSVEKELESLRQERIILELFGEVCTGEEQGEYIEDKEFQIKQLEEALEELKLRRREAEEMLKDAEQFPFVLFARTQPTNATITMANVLLFGIIAWLALLTALGYTLWILAGKAMLTIYAGLAVTPLCDDNKMSQVPTVCC